MTDNDEYNENETLIGYTVEIVSAHVGHNSVAMADVPLFIQQVHGALATLHQPAAPEEPEVVPIVPVRQSVKPDYLVCLECGKKMKTLKQHLRNIHGLTPEDYRAKYGLPADYPMMAPNVTVGFRERAVSLGLGKRMLDAKLAKAAAKRHLRPVAKVAGK